MKLSAEGLCAAAAPDDSTKLPCPTNFSGLSTAAIMGLALGNGSNARAIEVPTKIIDDRIELKVAIILDEFGWRLTDHDEVIIAYTSDRLEDQDFMGFPRKEKN